jgi:hypothetical protein
MTQPAQQQDPQRVPHPPRWGSGGEAAYAPTRPARDRTSLVVRMGLLLLLVVGVASIFGDALLGLAGASGSGPQGSPQENGPASPSGKRPF